MEESEPKPDATDEVTTLFLTIFECSQLPHVRRKKHPRKVKLVPLRVYGLKGVDEDNIKLDHVCREGRVFFVCVCVVCCFFCVVWVLCVSC